MSIIFDYTHRLNRYYIEIEIEGFDDGSICVQLRDNVNTESIVLSPVQASEISRQIRRHLTACDGDK